MTGKKLIAVFIFLVFVSLTFADNHEEQTVQIPQMETEEVIRQIENSATDSTLSLQRFTVQEFNKALAERPDLVQFGHVVEEIQRRVGVLADVSVLQNPAVLRAFLQTQGRATVEGNPMVAYYDGSREIGFRRPDGSLGARIADITDLEFTQRITILENGELRVQLPREDFSPGQHANAIISEGLVRFEGGDGATASTSDRIILENGRVVLGTPESLAMSLELHNSELRIGENIRLSSETMIRLFSVNGLRLSSEDVLLSVEGIQARISGGFILEPNTGEIVALGSARYPVRVALGDTAITLESTMKIQFAQTGSSWQSDNGGFIRYDHQERILTIERPPIDGTLSISTRDGALSHLSIARIPLESSSIIELTIRRDGHENPSTIIFSSDPPISQRSFEGLEMRISHLFSRTNPITRSPETYAFVIFNGVEASGLVRGEIPNYGLQRFDIFLDRLDPAVLEFLVRSSPSLSRDELNVIAPRLQSMELKLELLGRVGVIEEGGHLVRVLSWSSDAQFQARVFENFRGELNQADLIGIFVTVNDAALRRQALGYLAEETVLRDRDMISRLLELAKSPELERLIVDMIAPESGLQSAYLLRFATSPDEINRIIELIPKDNPDAIIVAMRFFLFDPETQLRLIRNLNRAESYEFIALFRAAASDEVQRYLIETVRHDSISRMASLFTDAKSPEVQLALVRAYPESASAIVFSGDFGRAKSAEVQMVLLGLLSDEDRPRTLRYIADARSPEVQERIIGTINQWNLDSLSAIFTHAQNDRIRELLISRMGSIGPYTVTDITTFTQFREVLLNTPSAEAALALLEQGTFNKQPSDSERGILGPNALFNFGWDRDALIEVFRDPRFREATAGLSGRESWDIAISVLHNMERAGLDPIGLRGSGQDFGTYVRDVMEFRLQNQDRVLLGPGVTYIPIVHDETISATEAGINYRFQLDRMTALALDSGVDRVIPGFRGVQSREPALLAIETSTGLTTVHFSGHGSPNGLGLANWQPGTDFSAESVRANAISPADLATALLARQANGQSISQVNLILDACLTYDFAQNLYTALQERGARSFPTIVTIASRNQLGYGTRGPGAERIEINQEFVYQITRVREPQSYVTLGTVFGADRSQSGDWAVLVPSGSSVSSYGSTYDDYYSLPSTVDPENVIAPDRSDEPGRTFIEIGRLGSGPLNFG